MQELTNIQYILGTSVLSQEDAQGSPLQLDLKKVGKAHQNWIGSVYGHWFLESIFQKD